MNHFWKAALPATWPRPPETMTVSTLAEIEACPRRWALSTASYPELWNGRGYPQRLFTSALAGTILHLAIETIVKGLVQSGCSSVHDPAAALLMKELGGYTNLLNKCLYRTLERYG